MSSSSSRLGFTVDTSASSLHDFQRLSLVETFLALAVCYSILVGDIVMSIAIGFMHPGKHS